MFVCISGISSSGKTTIGKLVAEKLGYVFVDLDLFYLPRGPNVILSNGIVKKNWDCLETLDFELLNSILENNLYIGRGVILVGFTLQDDLLYRAPDVHIHLSMGNTESEIIERCILSRKRTKKVKDDELMVREVVYPFYVETLSKSTITYTIETYLGEIRKSIDIIFEEVSRIIT